MKDTSGTVGRPSRVVGGRPLSRESDSAPHLRKIRHSGPACRRMLAALARVKSADGLPAIVTKPGLSGCRRDLARSPDTPSSAATSRRPPHAAIQPTSRPLSDPSACPATCWFASACAARRGDRDTGAVRGAGFRGRCVCTAAGCRADCPAGTLGVCSAVRGAGAVSEFGAGARSGTARGWGAARGNGVARRCGAG
jgi:hypothetical protein